MNLGPYGKTIIAVFTGVAAWAMLVAQAPGGFSDIDGRELLELATALAIGLGVWTVPGDLFGKATKVIAAVVVGVIGWGWGVLDSVPAGWTDVEIVQLITVLGIAFGVYQVSNAPGSTGPLVGRGEGGSIALGAVVAVLVIAALVPTSAYVLAA